MTTTISAENKAAYETRLEQYRIEREQERQSEREARKVIKKYCNFIGYTDREPYEVVKVISPICVEIRRMKATLVEGWKPDMHVGGFSAHTANNHSQSYNYESDPEAGVGRVRWSKAKGNWYAPHGGLYHMADAPFKFYDYNF